MTEESSGIYFLFQDESGNVQLIAVQLASAVSHLHLVHSVAHRDIKPDVRIP